MRIGRGGPKADSVPLGASSRAPQTDALEDAAPRNLLSFNVEEKATVPSQHQWEHLFVRTLGKLAMG